VLFPSLRKQVKSKTSALSVKEYFTSSQMREGLTSKYSIEEQQAHNYLARSCPVYLPDVSPLSSVQWLQPEPRFNFGDLIANTKSGRMAYSIVDSAMGWLLETLSKKYPLLKYATCHWANYVRNSGSYSIMVNPAILQFFSSQDFYVVWSILSMNPFYLWYCPKNSEIWPSQLLLFPTLLFTIKGTVESPLYYASYLGLFDIARSLLDGGANPNEIGGGFGCPLAAASQGGHLGIVKYLLLKGACVIGISNDSG
jgi:hypothetical protein